MSKRNWVLVLVLSVILAIGNVGIAKGDVVIDTGGHDNITLPTSNKSNFAEDRVLVKLTNNPGIHAMSLDFGIDFSKIRLLNPSKEINDLSSFSTADITDTQNNVFVLTLAETGAESVERALEILNANSAVEIAEPDYIYEFISTPNDPLYNAQYALHKINAPQAWDITTGSKSVVVGIIDSGIDGMHPDLKDNLWVNQIRVKTDI